MSTRRLPSYRHHKPSQRAVVTINGRDHYLGPWNSKASRLEYDRLVAEWLASGRRSSSTMLETPRLTVVEVMASYRRHAQSYYRKDGQPTSEVAGIDHALRFVRRLYGRFPAVEFGPLKLVAVQRSMIDAELSRGVINQQTSRIKRMFRWAVAQELVPPDVYHGLAAVQGLKQDRTEARETAPIEPVDDSTVESTLSHLPQVVADMARFQRLTGARPGEVCSLQPCAVDKTATVWTYKPESHKTQHHGRERVIFIGPKAQDILRRYLLRPSNTHCFSPKDSERKRLAEAHAKRQTPIQYGNSPGSNKKRKPRRTAGIRYDKNSYRRAIHRACVKAGVEKWSPNRLRHSAATEIRRRFGLEAAQVTLGHASANVTQVYAERDLNLAERVMKEVG